MERAAFQADAAKTRANLEDGTLFDQIREELNREVTGKGPEEHAKASEFLDLIRDNIHVPLPQDLIDFANRHRRPPA